MAKLNLCGITRRFPCENLWAQQNEDGNTAFHLALENYHYSVLELACQQRIMSILTVSGYLRYTPFLEAATWQR